jgi:menaquinone-dependent protoporphyrinogen IX oxidase
MKYADLTTYRAAKPTRREAEALARELRAEGHQAHVLDATQYTDEPVGYRWLVVDERDYA